MLARFGLLVLIFGVLSGCSPDYNWRKVVVADGLVTTIFPDKPKTQQKTLSFSGSTLEFALTGTTVGKTIFAVGHATLPEAVRVDEALRLEMGRSVIRSFYQNMGVAIPSPLPDFGTRFEINGQSSHGPVTLHAVVWLLSDALVESIVTAPSQTFPLEQASEFLKSTVVAAR